MSWSRMQAAKTSSCGDKSGREARTEVSTSTPLLLAPRETPEGASAQEGQRMALGKAGTGLGCSGGRAAPLATSRSSLEAATATWGNEVRVQSQPAKPPVLPHRFPSLGGAGEGGKYFKVISKAARNQAASHCFNQPSYFFI